MDGYNSVEVGRREGRDRAGVVAEGGVLRGEPSEAEMWFYVFWWYGLRREMDVHGQLMFRVADDESWSAFVRNWESELLEAASVVAREDEDENQRRTFQVQNIPEQHVRSVDITPSNLQTHFGNHPPHPPPILPPNTPSEATLPTHPQSPPAPSTFDH